MIKKLSKLSLVAVLAFALVLGVGAGSAQAVLTLGTTSMTSDGNVTINGVATSVYAIGATTTTGTITIGGTAQEGTVSLGTSTAAMTLNLGTGNGAKTVAIATGTGIDTINIGTGGTAADDINIGDALADVDITGASAFVAGTGDALTITGNAASTWSTTAGDLTLSADAASVNVNANEAAADQIKLSAAGTIAGNAININTTNGGIVLTAANVDNGDLTLTVGDDYVANVTGIWDNNVTGAATVDAASISLDATTASNLTVTGAGQDLTLASVLGSVAISSTEDAASAISLIANSIGTNDTIVITNTPGTAVGAIALTATVGGVTVTGGVASADAVNIVASNAAGGIDIDSGTGGIIADSTGVVSIDGADDMNFTVTAGTAGEDLTISEIGGNDSSVILTSAGTGTDAIGIHATAGGIDIDTASTAAAALDIDATGTVAGNAITVNTTDGGIAIVAAGADNGDITITAGDDFTLTGVSTSAITIGNASAGLRYYEETETVASSHTLTIGESGKTFYWSGTGYTLTLPAVSTANGVHYRFVVGAAFATNAVVQTGNTTENKIDGIFIQDKTTDGADIIDCRTEDTVTFVADGEQLGDYIELRSNGSAWFLSGAVDTAAKITCTTAS